MGDVQGRVTVLELCEGLHVCGANEKAAVGAMFDREARREKNIEMARKQTEGKRQDEKQSTRTQSAAVQEAVAAAREAFFKVNAEAL